MGIDLTASRFNNDGIEVGQCKCYRDFQPKEIYGMHLMNSLALGPMVRRKRKTIQILSGSLVI